MVVKVLEVVISCSISDSRTTIVFQVESARLRAELEGDDDAELAMAELRSQLAEQVWATKKTIITGPRTPSCRT